MRENQRHEHRPDGRRGAQPAESDHPDVQDFLRKQRQQRHRPAEQHGEKIERDRGKDDL